MFISERIKVSPIEATSTTLNHGVVATATPIFGQIINPGETARHETAHVIAAGNIVEANIIPRGNALGTTTPVTMTPVAAAAAGALGYGGTSHDRFVTEVFMNTSWDLAKKAAQATLSGQEDLMEAVAIKLEEKKSITQYDVDVARHEVEEKRMGVFPVRVVVYDATGIFESSFEARSFHGEIEVFIGNKDNVDSEAVLG